MNKKSLKLLQEMLQTPSPSGFEQAGQKRVMTEMQTCADTVSTDVLGNVIGCLNPNGAPSVLLAGHGDEIGYMVTYIGDDGFLRVGTIGGPRLECASGRKVWIHTANGPVVGVMMRQSLRTAQEGENKDRKLEAREFWIDIGADDRKDAEKRVALGDPITLDADFFPLHHNLVTARAFDDRIGVFIIIETLRRLKGKPLTAAVHGVSTVQEETGGRGAQICGFNIHPDIAIAIDVVHASDSPEMDEKLHGRIALGKGPVLLRGCNITPPLGKFLEKVAQKNKIPVQIEAAPMPTWTDADPLQRMHGGAATALVKIPVRYMHAPTEIISLNDVENAILLLCQFLLALDPSLEINPVTAP